jgi:acylphosphatase
MINIQLRITGKVQGVYFRQSTLKMAEIIGLKGFVKNEPDGSVFVEAEGENASVYKLIDYCHHGPEGAAVEHVSIIQGEIAGYNNFEIRK